MRNSSNYGGSGFGLVLLGLFLVAGASAQVDQQRAESYFKEVAAICKRDSGRLWGVSLCGPIVFADRRTKTIASNQSHPEGGL